MRVTSYLAGIRKFSKLRVALFQSEMYISVSL